MWPDKVLRQFSAVPPSPSEADFHAPYNKLLYTLFPADTDFVVVPQFLPDSRSSFDFIVMFEVLLQNKPVLVLGIKPPSHLNLLSKRQTADDQIRLRLGDLVATCPIDTLHAVSALGTKLAFYSLETGDNDAEIIPLRIPRHPTRLNDTAPANRWNYNILEAEGEARFLAVVEEIKEKCAQLS